MYLGKGFEGRTRRFWHKQSQSRLRRGGEGQILLLALVDDAEGTLFREIHLWQKEPALIDMYFDFVSKTHLWQKEPALCQKQFHGQLHIIFCWKSRLASNKWNIIFWCPWFPGKLFSVTHGLKSTKQVMSINKFQKAFSFYSSKSTKLSPRHQLRLSECFLETLQLVTKNIGFIIKIHC